MTPLQKRRHSTRRQGKRRASQLLRVEALQACTNCGQPTMSHQVCPHCGFYKGKAVVIKSTAPPSK